MSTQEVTWDEVAGETKSDEEGAVKHRATASYPLMVVGEELPENPARKAREGGYTTGPRTPRWTGILQAVADMGADKGFILAGEFGTAVGARNVLKTIEKANDTDTPIVPKGLAFEFETRRFMREDGKKGSRLYVRFTGNV